MLKIDVKHCARCQQDHNQLEFKEFTINPIEYSDGTVWNYWALCPVTQEPILLKIRETGDQV
jgi:hypothetical protein